MILQTGSFIFYCCFFLLVSPAQAMARESVTIATINLAPGFQFVLTDLTSLGQGECSKLAAK